MGRYTNRLLVIAVLLVGASGLTPERAEYAEQKEPSDLLQFTASGHALGFEAEGVYVASGDHMLRVEFAGTSGVAPVAEGMSSGGGQAESLDRVTYAGLWPGISLSYDHVAGGIVQSNYLLEPGADVSQIRLRYNAPVEIETGGSLQIKYGTGQMRESAPVAWQDINGRRLPVEVAFRLLDSPIRNPVVGFALGQYDPAYSLTIDPTLQWNTFLGAVSGQIGMDHGSAIAVDGSGNVYVAGYSRYSWGSPVRPHSGNSYDTFVAKLNSSGTLLWSTFLGGDANDVDSAIALDDGGNVYVAGSSDYTWGSPVNPFAGGTLYDAFAAKLNSSGSLQWNTFMGTSNNDHGYGIAVDGSGNLYVTGRSATTWGSPVNAHAGGFDDAFAAKLDNSGSLLWNTFMGSSVWDYGNAIAVDGTGAVYVAGFSEITWGSPVNPHAGGTDAFVAKLNVFGTLLWHTFMGSSFWDSGYAIAVDGSGNVYVGGTSSATWGSPVNPHAGYYEAFAAKLNNSGSLQWNTFMGSSGPNDDWGYAIAVDGSGNVYVAGRSEGTWGSPVNAYAGGDDAFAAKLDSSGTLQLSTFMGCSADDRGHAIAVDGSGGVYVAGESWGTWGSPVNAYAGSLDAFAAKPFSSGVSRPPAVSLPCNTPGSGNVSNPLLPVTPSGPCRKLPTDDAWQPNDTRRPDPSRIDVRRASREALLTALSGGYDLETRLTIVRHLAGRVDLAVNELLMDHLEAISSEAEARGLVHLRKLIELLQIRLSEIKTPDRRLLRLSGEAARVRER